MQKVNLSNKVFTDNPLLDEIVYNARQLSTNTVLKDMDKANNNETTESLTNGDLLISIHNGTVSFDDFIYDYDILYQYYGNDSRLRQFEANNSLIPEEDRENLKNMAIKLFNKNFVEYNNYYRQLHGDPPINEGMDDYEGLWIDVNYIDESVPTDLSHIYPYYVEETDQYGNVISDYRLIHELSINKINILYDNGTIDNILEDTNTIVNTWGLTPEDVRYIQHLGDKSIDYYEARTAERFQMLYCPDCDSDEVKKRYKDLLEANRLYMLYTIYSDAYKYRSDYYDNFMMVLLVIQTIIDLILELPDYVMRRDIFDARTCRYIFESNGVKYFKDIPLRYQLSLVKNLNRLIKYKSTDQCIIDIASLFGFKNNIRAFRYYILRDRRIDNPDEYTRSTLQFQGVVDGKTAYSTDPEAYVIEAENKMVIPHGISEDEIRYFYNKKVVTDTTGETYIVDDNDRNYDLKFIKVPLLGKYDDYIREKNNIYDYDTITEGDSTWIGDKNYERVKSSIKDLDFNVLRSKYYTVEAVVDLTKRNFTVVYFMNMLLYNKIDSSALTLSLPNVSTTSRSTLVNTILALYALSYFYYGVEDTIMDTRYKTASILGFNMETDMSTLATYIEEHYNELRMDDNNTLETLGVSGFTVPSDGAYISYDQLQEIYFTNKDIYDHVRSVMMDPPNKQVYNAYKYIYNALFVMNRNMEYFLIGDTDIVDQYKENGYTTHFIVIPNPDHYTNPEEYERDYRLFLERLNETTLYFEQSEYFEDDHAFNLYIFDGTDLVPINAKVTMAKTYTEYLRYNDVNLYNFLSKIINMSNAETRQEACVNAIQTIISYMKDYIDQDGEDAIYLDEVFSGLPSISLEFVKHYVEEVIDFFKSFEIFTHSSSTIYVFNDKFENYVQLIDQALFNYFFEKSEYIKIEDAINKSKVDISHSEKMKIIDKIWLDIDTWVQKNYQEYYNSDKYSELCSVIRDYKEFSTTITLSSKVFEERYIKEIEQLAVDAILHMLVDIEFHDESGIHDCIAEMNWSAEYEDHYNEWMSDLAILLTTITLEDGIVTNTHYYCTHCGKEMSESDILCPHCGELVLEPIVVHTHITNIIDNMLRYSTLIGEDNYQTYDKISGNNISFIYKELSPMKDDIHIIRTQEFPPHVFN